MSWRLLPCGPPNVAFNVTDMDKKGDHMPVNSEPVCQETWVLSDGQNVGRYFVEPVVGGKQGPNVDDDQPPHLSFDLRESGRSIGWRGIR